MPLQVAGMRIEPPPSVPTASGPSPAPTAAAAPPLLPPGLRSRFHGLRVMPVSGLSVTNLCPSSGVVVLPTITAPCSRSLATAGASSAHAWSGFTVREPCSVGIPRVSRTSLIDTGTPSSRPLGCPASQRASDAFASCKASSETRLNALNTGFSASMRFSTAAVTSTGDLYVADPGNNRVGELGAQGEFVRAFGQGVIDGAAQFQVCSDGTGCQAGTPGLGLGAISLPFGLAVDCFGAVHVAEQGIVSRVERFGEPGTAVPPCPPPPPPATISATPAPISATISNRFRFAGLKLNRGNGSAALFVRIPAAGKLILWGRGVRRFKRTAGRATLVRLPIRPKTPLKRYLKRHGKAPIHIKVAFEPFGGVAKAREKRIVLRRKRRH